MSQLNEPVMNSTRLPLNFYIGYELTWITVLSTSKFDQEDISRNMAFVNLFKASTNFERLIDLIANSAKYKI